MTGGSIDQGRYRGNWGKLLRFLSPSDVVAGGSMVNPTVVARYCVVDGTVQHTEVGLDLPACKRKMGQNSGQKGRK
jgi:hypothetical protein